MISRRQFLVGGSLLALAGCSGRGEEEPLFVGHVGPLSGPERAIGEHTRRGILLAVADANGAEGKVGGRRLAVLHADGRGDAEHARHEAVRLASLNRLTALLGGHDHAAAAALARAVQPYLIPLLTPAVYKGAAERIFSLDATADFRGRTLARFAGEEFKERRPVVLVEQGLPVCADIAAAFANHARGSGGVIPTRDVSDDESVAGLPDLLGKGDADLPVIAASARTARAIREVLAKAALTPPILFAGEEADWHRLTSAGLDDAIPLYGATPYATASFEEAGKTFLEHYAKAYGEPADVFAFQGYEMVRILADALRATKGAGAEKLLAELGRKDGFAGLTGKVTFKSGQAARSLFIVQAGKDEVLLSVSPDVS